jgi:hypothetical protein
MNKKFSFALLVVAFVLTACAPVATGVSAPIDPQMPALVPVTGENATVVRTVSEPRLFSGEIFQSDTNNPDRTLQLETGVQQKSQSECMSEDSLPKRASGCIE